MDKNLDNDEKFYRLPKRLFTEEQFQNMTGAAKLLYMILLDRRCLSELNGDAERIGTAWINLPATSGTRQTEQNICI